MSAGSFHVEESVVRKAVCTCGWSTGSVENGYQTTEPGKAHLRICAEDSAVSVHVVKVTTYTKEPTK